MMNNFRPLIVLLGVAAAASSVSTAQATDDYSDLRPPYESTIEAPPAHLDQGLLIERTGTIEEVDLASRLVTIKGPEGEMITVHAGDEVKNLDQIQKGDQVTVSYLQSTAVDIMGPGETAGAPKTTVEAAKVTAGPGAKPAGAVARQKRTTVKIVSVDPYKKTIAFRGQDGRYREVSMDTPHLEHYLDEIKDGDTVDVVYTEALAVSISAK